MANIITFVRFLCSIALLFVPNFSAGFYSLYVSAGISDMLDGFVARKTNSTSEFGAKLDGIADVTFVVACFIKILPCFNLRLWVWIWIAFIAIIKITNILSGVIFQKKIVMPHTVANKITGFFLFLTPLFLRWIDIFFLAVPLCVSATFAAVQEGVCIGKLIKIPSDFDCSLSVYKE